MDSASLLWQKHQPGRVDETMLYETGARRRTLILGIMAIEETMSYETRARRRMLVAIAVSLLVLAASVLWISFYWPSVQPAQKQGEKRTLADLPGALKLGAATSSTMQAQMNYGLKPAGTLPISATGTEGLGDVPSQASPEAVIELLLPPLPATDAGASPRQDPSAVKECPQAVATLGLCNQLTKQENP